MARSLTKEQAEILIELLSTSDQFEAGKKRNAQSALDAIARLGTLGNIAKASLGGAPVTAPQPSQQAQPFTPPPVAQVSPSYESKREEYKPALKDRSVVEALLEFHRQNAVPEPKARPASKLAPPTFAPADIPVVNAAPKRAPLGRSASRVTDARPVLSPTSPTRKKP